MKPICLQAILQACEGTYYGPSHLLEEEITDISIDSRKIRPGSLFVAIHGETMDGHQFIPNAIEKGALCVISHHHLENATFPYILVKSTGDALLNIAKFYRESFPVKVVCITGSVGKTSTKEMIASVLSSKFSVHKTLGNFNNEWGLPITLFEMNPSHEVAVLELGVNHFDEMRRLSRVAQPDICVITNIGVAHLEFFKTREGILEEKSKMIQDLKEGGSIVLNGEDDLLATLPSYQGISPIFYGNTPNASCYATEVEPLGLKGTRCTIHLPDHETFSCIIPLPGAHMISNALAGASVGWAMGLTSQEIKQGIESLPSMPGRNHIIHRENLIILDDCYNANPVSMKAALDVLSLAQGRKIAILGNMGELGTNEVLLHKEVGEYAAFCNIDFICGIGHLAKDLVQAATESDTPIPGKWFATKADFLKVFKDYIQPGDNVLVKASHGMEFPEIVEALSNL